MFKRKKKTETKQKSYWWGQVWKKIEGTDKWQVNRSEQPHEKAENTHTLLNGLLNLNTDRWERRLAKKKKKKLLEQPNGMRLGLIWPYGGIYQWRWMKLLMATAKYDTLHSNNNNKEVHKFVIRVAWNSQSLNRDLTGLICPRMWLNWIANCWCCCVDVFWGAGKGYSVAVLRDVNGEWNDSMNVLHTNVVMERI